MRQNRAGRSAKPKAFTALSGICAVLALLWMSSPTEAMDRASMPRMKMPGMNTGQGLMQTKVAGDYRIELHVLPPEPFYTAAEVTAQHLHAGMLIAGGAAPLPPDASPRPNHHLIVHVFDNKSGAALTDAQITLSFRPADSTGRPTGDSVVVPVVVMQAIGAGAASTHYGTNVVIPAGTYLVTVGVNGTTATFPIHL